MKTFPLLRPEKGRWYLAGIACWVGLFVYFWAVRDHLKFENYLFVAILFLVAIIRDLRLRRTPDRRVEIDAEAIHLFPSGYWTMDTIPWSAMLGRREEGEGIFLHFKDQGTERAVLLERKLFTREDWDELVGFLREDTGIFPLAC